MDELRPLARCSRLRSLRIGLVQPGARPPPKQRAFPVSARPSLPAFLPDLVAGCHQLREVALYLLPNDAKGLATACELLEPLSRLRHLEEVGLGLPG